MKNIFIFIFGFLIFALISAGTALGSDSSQISATSATLNQFVYTKQEDNRALILKQYLENQNSPLATYAQDFVSYADKYNLDWRLVASIAGLESSFGLHQPAGSHNGWGWGYNNGTVKHFDTWEAAIEEISRGLRVNYLKERPSSDPYVIGPTYAASPTWAQRVTYFMNQIENYRAKNSKSTLSLAL